MSNDEIKKRFERLKQLIISRKEHELNDQKFKTDINFSDIFDKNLLEYAVFLGELDEVKSLLVQGAQSNSALPTALKEGHLKVADHLFSQGFVFNELALADIKDPECRSWFINMMQQSIAKEKENKSVFFARKQRRQLYASIDPFNIHIKTISKLNRVAELGDVQFIAQYKSDPAKYKKYESQLASMLLSACANNQLKMVELLLQDGATVNHEKPYCDSPLYVAASYGCVEVINYLLIKGGNVNYQNSMKMTALLTAIHNKHTAVIHTLLKHGADVTLTNHRHHNPLHVAVLANNIEGLELLVKHPKFQTLLEEKDIYGKRPIDYARQSNNTALIHLLDNSIAENWPGISSSINQGSVMQKMSYYLRLNYRSSEFFSAEGHCNGFSYLWDMYCYQGRESYYFDTLRLMASWDGTQEQLDAPFPPQLEQSKYYKNLAELFEQWINDMIWFQHGGTIEQLGLRIEQSDRMKQSKLISATLSPKVITSQHDNNMTRLRLIEYFKIYLNNMPPGTRIQLAGSEHATAAHLKDDGMIAYYDPNFFLETGSIEDVTQWEQCFIDTKIIALDKSKFNEQNELNFECDLQFFYYDEQGMEHVVEQHEAVAQDKLPQSLEEAELFQSQSPNQFTPLHIAALCGSIVTVNQLLSPKVRCVDINSPDCTGRTALDIAVKSGNSKLIEVLVAHYRGNDSLNTRSLLSADLNDTKIVDLLFNNKDRIDIGMVLLEAIESKNINLIKRIIASGAIDINEVELHSISPLCAAFKTYNIEIINLLLENGASLTKVKKLDNPYFENSPLMQLAHSRQDIINEVLKKLTDVNQTDDYGNSLIHYLPWTDAMKSQFLMDYILQHGGDLEKKSAAGSTIFEQLIVRQMTANTACTIILPHLKLDQASDTTLELLNNYLIEEVNEKKHEHLSHILIYYHGKLLDRTDKNGGSALLYAALQGDLRAVELLLKAGADVNMAGKPNGQTALHLAVKHNLPDLVSFLIDNGAEPEQMNTAKETPKDLVNEETSEDIRQALGLVSSLKNSNF